MENLPSIITQPHAEKWMATSTIKKLIPSKSAKSWYGVYPNGRVYNKNFFRVTVACWNPYIKPITLGDLYVYDSGGGFTQITGATVEEIYADCFTLFIPFNSTHAGRMLRIDYS